MYFSYDIIVTKIKSLDVIRDIIKGLFSYNYDIVFALLPPIVLQTIPDRDKCVGLE